MVTDFEKALATLSGAGVEFVVIGGVAGTLHGSAFIVLKRAAGRPKDLAVVAELQGILERKKGKP